MREVLSQLGTAESPVRRWINAWWCVFGLLVVLFAWGYYRAFAHGAVLSAGSLAAWLLVLFGVGAGPGAGLFPMDAPGREPTLTGTLHHWISGAGFVALVFVPALGLAVFRGQAPALFWLSCAVLLGGLGLLGVILASGRPGASGLLALGGLWQRTFLLNYYVYVAAIAVVMLRR
jgi:hypothetical protein